MAHQIDMTSGSITKKLFSFSLPLIFSSILQLLFNAADIIVVGRYAGDAALSAVGSTSSLINLLVNLFVGLSVGTTVVCANYFGAGKKKEVSDTVHTAIILSVISGFILTIIGFFGAKEILRLMQAPEEVLNLATTYLKIYFGGITVTIIYNFGSALLRAKGDTKRPLYILFLAGIINVVLNLIFVIVFKIGVAGVATATVISQAISAFLILFCLWKENDEFKFSFSKLKINGDILRRIIKIGVPAGFQGMVFSFSNVIIQSSINSFGVTVIAGNSAASNIEGFIYTSMNGFAQGTLTFVSQNLGAKKFDRIGKVVFVSLGSVLLVGTALMLIVMITGPKLLGFYTASEDVILSGMVRLRMICIPYVLCGIMDVMANSIRGIGSSLLPMVVTMVGACGIRLLWLSTIFMIPQFHTYKTILLSYPISWSITFAVLTICFMIIFNKKKAKV
ncbi:MAG: MATE family efflux transporter [Spirochaetaceae bacterium]|nr:MATE family efflux transporter [Spirochaetaceae bacterium]